MTSNAQKLPGIILHETEMVKDINANEKYDVEGLYSHNEDGSANAGSQDGSKTDETSLNRFGKGITEGEDQDNLYFAMKENVKVQRLKLIIMIILVVVAIDVCAAVFFVTSAREENEYEAT